MREKEVRRLQVPVHDAEDVRLGDGLARLEHVVDRHDARQRTALLEEHVEVRSVEILHDEIGPTVAVADIEDAHDVLAADLGRRASLLHEARGELRVRRELGQEKLDGHALLELQMRRREDDGHAALPEGPIDAVFAVEDRPDRRESIRSRRRRPARASTRHEVKHSRGSPLLFGVSGTPSPGAGSRSATQVAARRRVTPTSPMRPSSQRALPLAGPGPTAHPPPSFAVLFAAPADGIGQSLQAPRAELPAPAELVSPNAPLEPRSAYGGAHCICAGCVGAGSQSDAVGPPSIDTGSAQAMFETACGATSHVQPEGQSLADEQTTVFAEQ